MGLSAVYYKKNQIRYIDQLIYMGESILLMLSSISPETDEIIFRLKSDSRLKDIDFEDECFASPLNPDENERIENLFSVLGHYDNDSQIKYINDFISYFKLLKEQYQEYYAGHYRLYITLGLFSGVLISVLLM